MMLAKRNYGSRTYSVRRHASLCKNLNISNFYIVSEFEADFYETPHFCYTECTCAEYGPLFPHSINISRYFKTCRRDRFEKGLFVSINVRTIQYIEFWSQIKS